MINQVSNSQAVNLGKNSGNKSNTIDFYNASPKDLQNYFAKKVQTGEVSLKEALPFMVLDTTSLEQKVGKEISLKYASRVWDQPNLKRDMVKEYKSMLEEMKMGNADRKSIELVENAIRLLEKYNGSSSFSNIIHQEMQKP